MHSKGSSGELPKTNHCHPVLIGGYCLHSDRIFFPPRETYPMKIPQQRQTLGEIRSSVSGSSLIQGVQEAAQRLRFHKNFFKLPCQSANKIRPKFWPLFRKNRKSLSRISCYHFGG